MSKVEKKKSKDAVVFEPRIERTEIANCIGCVPLALVGGSFNVALVSYGCGVTPTGILG